jgi:cytosine/adenosine deaminase-related metal-dependent hydrolase
LIILKNAFVLTFNKDNDTGRYSILINEKKITDIADSSPKGKAKADKWIQLYSNTAEVIDCSGKIVMPPLVNSCLKSEGTLLHYLLKRRHYEKTEEDICTDLIFNYLYQELAGETLQQDLKNIYSYSFLRQLKSGVLSFNELSLRKDTNHYSAVSSAVRSTGQNISLCYPIKQDVSTIRDFKYLNPSYYLTQENLLTVYDISVITELRSHNLKNLFLEVAVNKEITEKFKQTFHKSVVSLLDEYQLIDENTTFINPLYLDYSDLKIISDKKANVIVCPRDLSTFTERYFPVDDFTGHGIKFSIATGWLGEDLLKEVRLFRNKHKEINFSNAELLYSITKIPYELYFCRDGGADSGYNLDIGEPANMIFIDLSDSRFQFFPENYSFERVCEFIVDNLVSYNVSDVMHEGVFMMKNGKSVSIEEDKLISSVNETRERLYRTGKYEELQKRSESKVKSDKLDMGGRSDDEIKMFSDNADETVITDTSEEFRIKTRIPAFRPKPVPGQRSLFEQHEQSAIVQSQEFQESPSLNLLLTDVDAGKSVEEDIIQAKNVDETIIKRLSVPKKPEKPVKPQHQESKIELPKNVKLKFGDD